MDGSPTFHPPSESLRLVKGKVLHVKTIIYIYIYIVVTEIKYRFFICRTLLDTVYHNFTV